MMTGIWDLYKDNEKGKNLIALFEPNLDDITKTAADILRFSLGVNTSMRYEDSLNALMQLCLDNPDLSELPDEMTKEAYTQYILAPCNDANSDSEKNKLCRFIAGNIHLESIALYLNHTFFKPILYPQRFDIIQRNCNAVGIHLPEIPRTNDYSDYLMYYYDICEAINQFQKENHLTDAEACACMYGCAEYMVSKNNKAIELPRPINVWFTGASKEDYVKLEKMENTEHVWACNERTRRGDIVVMYCKSPHKYIHSIWRATSEGIFNPFDYYHCRTIIGDGIKIPKITYEEFMSHPHFSQLPIARKNLQGLNGVELSSRTYSELLKVIEEKGGDVTALPKLFEKGEDAILNIKLEVDVEEQILIPLLDKLGYKHDDWSRQLSQKAGRGLKAIPDFVFFPTGEKHKQNSPFLIEAKLDMSSIRELRNAFDQAVSYARMMQCKRMAICDKERLIVYEVTSSGIWDQSNPIFENHWGAINNEADVYAELVKIIAPEIIKTL